MRRILWLLLALSLPAWATINGVNTSHIIQLTSAGNRNSRCPDGSDCTAAPEQPETLIYTNDFAGNPTNTADDAREGIDGTYYNIGIFADQSDINHSPDSASWFGQDCSGTITRVWDGNLANGTALPDFSIVDDPDEAGNKVLRYYMDATAKGYNTECSATLRHRAKMVWASHINNDPNGGEGYRIVPDIEHWAGWRFRLNCQGDIYNSGNGPSQFFLNESIANVTGEPAVYAKTTCTELVISPERYKTSTVWGGGSTIETKKTTVGPFAEDQWHCLVARWIKKPYSVGSATAYIPGTVGGPRAGIFEIYIDGVLQRGSSTFQYPSWTGTDHSGRTKIVNGATVKEFNAVYRTGIYWATNLGAAGSSVTVYQDDVKLAEGADRAADVNPPGCPTVQVCKAGQTGNCVPDWKI